MSSILHAMIALSEKNIKFKRQLPLTFKRNRTATQNTEFRQLARLKRQRRFARNRELLSRMMTTEEWRKKNWNQVSHA